MMELVEAKATPIHRVQGISALYSAWHTYFGAIPSVEQVAICFSQMVLETGFDFPACKNFNVGNIKVGSSWEGNYCMYPAGEYIGGKFRMFYPPDKQTWFRAYESSEEGMMGYLDLVANRPRYTEAWSQLIAGSLEGFSKGLHSGGYYTLSDAEYTRRLRIRYDILKPLVEKVDSGRVQTIACFEQDPGLVAVTTSHLVDRLAEDRQKGLDLLFGDEDGD